jgi:hypothetical protein
MKTFNSVFVLALGVLLSFGAFASEKKTFRHTFFGNANGNYTMVACSYAEPVVMDWAKKFGATEIEITCSGGIQPPGMITPISLTVKYIPTDLSGQTSQETIELESDGWNSNCNYDSSLMRAMLREFTNVKALRKSDACFTARDRYSFKLEVTTGK